MGEFGCIGILRCAQDDGKNRQRQEQATARIGNGKNRQYPPRKQQSASCSGPITLQQYERLQFIREQLGKEGIVIPIPTGN